MTTEGWYLYSVNESKTFSAAKADWGMDDATTNVYRYIYELNFGASGMPITQGTSLTSNNWLQIDTNTNPTLLPFKAYWVLVMSTGDNTAPVITVDGDATVYHKQNTTYTDAGATAQDDVDGVVAVTDDSTSVVDTSVEGTYTVTYTASDNNNNTATATRTVIVDGTAPAITLNGGTSVQHEKGAAYTDAGADALDTVDGAVTVTDDSASVVNINTEGTYTVTYTATDRAGNTATATRSVTVVDTTIPIISLIGDATVYHKQGEVYTDDGATAKDTIGSTDIDLTNNIVVTSTVNINTEGTYTVKYNVNDTAGTPNAANEVTRTVIVDGTAPDITVNGDNPVTVAHNATYVDNDGATATDAVDGTVVVTDDSDSVVDTSVAEANYIVTYTATDRAGNTATATRTVNIGPAAAATLTEGIIVNTTTGEVRLHDSNNAGKTINKLTWEGVPITEFIYGSSFTGIQAVTNQVDSTAHTNGTNTFLSDTAFQCSSATTNIFGSTPAKFTGESGASPGLLTGDNIIFTIDLNVTGVFTSNEIPSVWKVVYGDSTEINQGSSGYNFQLTS